MTFYDWTTCPDPIKVQVNNFVEQIKIDLADNLTGIYLHGSLAMGCFNPQSSDIDMLIITDKPLTAQHQFSIAQITLDCSDKPIGFEFSTVAREYLDNWEHPCRYDFHFSEDWREKVTNEFADKSWQVWGIPMGKDDDLAGHVMVTKHRGVVLAGQAIDAVFPQIPADDYRDSIVSDFFWLLERDLQYKPYGILNMCRVLQFIREGAVSSKAEGGAWGLSHLPERYHKVIDAALSNYRDNTPMMDDKKLLDTFADYMREQIEDAT